MDDMHREALFNQLVPVLQMIRDGQRMRGELQLGDSPSQVMFGLAAEFLVGEHGPEKALEIVGQLSGIIKRGEMRGRRIDETRTHA